MENREWMYTGRIRRDDVTSEWITKTDAFLERAFGEATKGASLVTCSCSKCANRKILTKKTMEEHIWKNEFTPDYTWWIVHGEAHRTREKVVRQLRAPRGG
jgi:gluconate kinase